MACEDRYLIEMVANHLGVPHASSSSLFLIKKVYQVSMSREASVRPLKCCAVVSHCRGLGTGQVRTSLIIYGRTIEGICTSINETRENLWEMRRP